ncbi:CHAD domain-containing protein [Roseococcus sp. DSY-14]|uniref:CHAD domain-containing protein n=1 Tax=Roseococcus sp. DSY-14 TaxID=3369650 RepID=UPI00387AEC66
MELVLAPPARRPAHPLLDALPRPARETLAWFPAPDGRVVERRRGACRLLDPLGGDALPCPAPPPGTAPLARFAGRRWAMGAGVAWIEGRLLAGAESRRVARLVVEDPALAAALAADLPLLPAAVPLAEEALALAESRPPRAAAGPPTLRPGAAAEATLAAATRHLLAVLLAESARVSPDDPRGVHQSRVALRRLRSLVKMFRPAGEGWSEWNQALGALARSLGEARDWDVFTGGIAAGTLAALNGDARLRRLARAAEAERRAAYARLAAELAGPGFRALVFEGLRLAALPPPGDGTPLAPLAARLLRRRWKRLKRAGAVIEDLPAEALHEMRLDAKRLRYAAEPFAALWPGKRGRRFLRRLAALQEALGLANDAEVAKDLAARLAGRGAGGFAIGTVTGFAAGRAEGSRLAAIAAWRELARTPRFWHGEPES